MKIRDLEISIIKSLRGISSSFLDALMEGITILGEQYIIILGLAVIYFIYDKKIGQKIAYTLFTSLLLNNSIKGLVKYERPFTYDDSIKAVRQETATGYSFPSGHTQTAATFYFSVANNLKLKHVNKKLLWIIVSIIVLLIGFSRIYLAVHYPKDVIVGLILGLGCTITLSYLYDRLQGSFKKELIVLLITFVVFLPFIFIFYYKDWATIKLYRDFYTCYALFTGYIPAFIIDNKFVSFSCNTSLKKKLIRLLGAIICFALINIGLKYILPKEIIFIDFLRYFLTTFVVLGIYPLCFKNNLFKD